MIDAAAAPGRQWARLSRWSVLHFAARGVLQNGQMAYWLVPAMFGASMSNRTGLVLYILVITMLLVAGWAFLSYRMFSFRLLESSVQVRQGVLVRKQLDLPLERIQNVSFEHPFYFRPMRLVTIRIDGAGSSSDEVYLGALTLQQAESIRNDIIVRKRQLAVIPDGGDASGTGLVDPDTSQPEQLFFTRSLADLVVHGLTNNRAFLVIGGVIAFASQTPFSVENIFRSLGVDVGAYLAAQSISRLAILFVISFVLAMVVLAVLSVLVSIATHFRFRMHRSGDSFTVRRGLFTRHETHVRESRIQLVHYSQDWLDFLLGRRNVIFEQISHAVPGTDAQERSRTLVPAVSLRETAMLMSRILSGMDVDRLTFTPVSKLYFYKHAGVATALYLLAGVAVVLQDPGFVRYMLLLWPFHIANIYLRWRRAGLAVHGDFVVARSGSIGIDYRIVLAFRIQQVQHLQSLLMKRRGLSTIRLRTAASSIAVPWLDTSFAKGVINYCLYRIESTRRSWM